MASIHFLFLLVRGSHRGVVEGVLLEDTPLRSQPGRETQQIVTWASSLKLSCEDCHGMGVDVVSWASLAARLGTQANSKPSFSRQQRTTEPQHSMLVICPGPGPADWETKAWHFRCLPSRGAQLFREARGLHGRFPDCLQGSF